MMTNAANTTQGFETALWVILVMCAALFLLVMGLMIAFVFHYRRSRAPHPRVVKEPLWLEITWTVVPLFLVMIMFWYGYVGYRDFKKFSSDDFFEATVIGRMWLWEFEYPNGVSVQNDLYLPANKPIKLKITALDVNHSFYIPAFRIKQDAIPGFDNYLKFEAYKPASGETAAGGAAPAAAMISDAGEGTVAVAPSKWDEVVYDIYCAEYCGLQHAYMLGKVHILAPDDFNRWMAEQEAAKAEAAKKAESAEKGDDAEKGEAEGAEKAAAPVPAAPSGTSH